MRHFDLNDFYSNIAVCKISLSQDPKNYAKAFLVLPLTSSSNGDLLFNTRSPLIPTVFYSRTRALGVPKQVESMIRLLAMQQRMLATGHSYKSPYSVQTRTQVLNNGEYGAIAYVHDIESTNPDIVEQATYVHQASISIMGELTDAFLNSAYKRSVEEHLDQLISSDYERIKVAPKYIKPQNVSVIKNSQSMFQESTLTAIRNMVENRLSNFGLSLSSSRFQDLKLTNYFHILSINELSPNNLYTNTIRNEFLVEGVVLLSDGQVNGALMGPRKKPFLSANYDALTERDRAAIDFIDLNNIELVVEDTFQILNIPSVIGFRF